MMDKLDEKLKLYQKKRNYFLFFWLLVLVFMTTLGIVTIIANNDILWTISFVLTLLATVLFLKVRNNFLYINMSYQYLLMVKDNQQPIMTKKQLYTKKWLDQFILDGFDLFTDSDEYQIYYKFDKSISEFIKTANVLTIIIVAKTGQLDFYSDIIDNDILKINLSIKNARNFKQVVIQYKKYEQFNEKLKDETDRIINFKTGGNYIVHLSVAYINNPRSVYYLRPKKKYPNKMYYYACCIAHKYSVGEPVNEKR